MSEPAETTDQATIPEFLLVPAKEFGLDWWRFYKPLLAAGILFGLFDFFLPSLADAIGAGANTMLVLFGFAVIGAQITLIAVWGVIAPASLLARAVVTGLLLFMLYWCCLSGFAFTSVMPPSDEFIKYSAVMISFTPSLLLALQLPLWLAKVCGKWEVVIVSQPSALPGRAPVTIKDMLLATAVVAAALAIARLGASLLIVRGAPQIDDFMVGLGIAAGCAALWSFVVMLPLVSLILKTRSWEHGLLGTVACFLVNIAVILLVAAFVIGGLPSSSETALVGMGGYYLVTAAGLFAARIAGFRIQLAGAS